MMPPQNQKRMPPELIAELAFSLPMDVRWGIHRVSAVFDYFVQEKQLEWIKNELQRQKILCEKKRHLAASRQRVLKISRQIMPNRLANLRNNTAVHFRQPNLIGLTPQEIQSGVLTPEMFQRQLDAMLATIDQSLDSITWTARFLFTITDCHLGYSAIEGAPHAF
uniref:F-box domain-containing protein n=1 Tax=Globodera pallida TaxID=36090 RepID=A0A183C612_GLOPA